MDAPLLLWLTRVALLALPFTTAVHIADATDSSPGGVAVTSQVLFWVAWGAAVAVSLVPLPSTLTALRILVPLAPAASLTAAVLETPSAAGWVGLAAGAAAAVLVMAAAVGDWFVDGSSYGDERRFALKPPVALLAGPVPLAWVLTAVPLPTGILLIAGGAWIAGFPVVLVGIVTAWWGAFALWRLARRWLVLVPAGLTLVDEMAVAEPVLLPAADVARLGPAHVGTTATDLTVGAPGLVLQVDLSRPVDVTPTPRRAAVAESREVDALLLVPSRPAAVLDAAEGRRMGVARD